jgi:predicted house-cleaning noncanonical NTP pyrophosphatase (MazG superfamily)
MKTTFKFDKLIRDKAFELMCDAGVDINLKYGLSVEEVVRYYKKKIVEEAQEVKNSDSMENLLEELADCLEVIRGFAKSIGVTMEDLEVVRKEKKEKKGGFENNVVVENVSLAREGIFIPFYDYYIENSEKYPVVEKAK